MHTFNTAPCSDCGDLNGCHRAKVIPVIDAALDAVRVELLRAINGHERLNSLHEAYAVILEEVDELWEEVRKRRSDRDRVAIAKELTQIAAMAIRAIADILPSSTLRELTDYELQAPV